MPSHSPEPPHDVDAARALATRIAGRLAEVTGVCGVMLGGSWARRAGYADSDLDVGIFYDPEEPLDLAAVRALAHELDRREPAPEVTGIGEWGLWVNGGAWLEIEGWRVDWLYRDLERVGWAVDECCDGHPSCDFYLGHPHGFHNHIYLAELFHGEALFDPEGMLDELKQRVAEYPPALRRELVRRYLYDAAFMLELGRSTAGRGDVFHVTGCLFRVAAALVQVLYAHNERYFMNEKGSVRAVDGFPARPEQFAERVEGVLARAGDAPDALGARIGELGALLDETRALCGGG